MQFEVAITVPYTNARVYRHVGWDEYMKTHGSVTKFPDGFDIYDEVWDWCEANLTGYWRQWPNHLPKGNPLRGREIGFSIKDDAMLFKLRWCGAI
jgi:hypothetical protein